MSNKTVVFIICYYSSAFLNKSSSFLPEPLHATLEAVKEL